MPLLVAPRCPCDWPEVQRAPWDQTLAHPYFRFVWGEGECSSNMRVRMLQTQSRTKSEASVGLRMAELDHQMASLLQAAFPLTGFGEGALGRITPGLWGGPVCPTVSASQAPESRQEWGGGKQLLLEHEGSLGTAAGRK